jgi:hypothetical protein
MMTTRLIGGEYIHRDPAFPTHQTPEHEPGMDLRDYFAGRAMQALIAGRADQPIAGFDHDWRLIVAARSYQDGRRDAAGAGAEMSGHIKQSRSNWFCGPVIDGPFAGDWIDHDSPFYEGYFQQQLTHVASYGTALPSAVEIDRCFYKWLHGYRAWAWIQPRKRP